MRNPETIKLELSTQFKTWLPVFLVTMFYYHKDDQSFTQDASTLEIEIGKVWEYVKLVNPKTQQHRIYKLTKTLMDDSCEDVGGWEYTCTTQPNLKLTIWND